MPEQPKFYYGGQALIEGVMIRGRGHFSLAVRRQDGTITHSHEPLNSMFTGPIRKVPVIRGVLVLAETLTLGVKALHRSAGLAMKDVLSDEEEEVSGWVMNATMAVSLILGVALFFLLPLLLVRLIDSAITSDLASNIVEGLLRLFILLAYIGGIGLLKDIKRVFAYHGAEHKVVHAYEAGLPLTVGNVQKFPEPHPRCGTAFLLTVMLVSIIVFSFLGRPPIEWRILSRILMVPLIAGISYEVIRFSGAHQKGLFGRIMATPGLLMQRLTTRRPDDAQVEVAICAMEGALAADNGREYEPQFDPRPALAASGASAPAVPPAEANPQPQVGPVE